ncbi:DNA-processing protein DprA [Spiroplasma culicicola]|uniref:DNA processing/uptake protein n=1 Tax=Spiroplasma culicicola AES-1 TaxID=1276246 RepID=W6A6H9_9MOLU|nr:DNA-processing protein DprA [Spiroplasma culicicola]AHI52688.1 DNA processing/uptake protein [Spiroplasma culicicola AES-1]
MDKVLLYFSLKYHGDWDKIYQALDKKEKILHDHLSWVEQEINCQYITIISPLYPNYLKNTYKPPFVLFYKGNLELLSKYHRAIGVVGGREYDVDGLKTSKKIIDELSYEKRIIVTYEKYGLNNEIFNYCKEENKQHIYLLKSGIKNYLLQNAEAKIKDEQLILSEVYQLENDNVELENQYAYRLLCGLSKGVLFSQFSDDDHYNELINTVINEGKELFAIPFTNTEFNGTNKLIKIGAKLTENAKDVLNEI